MEPLKDLTVISPETATFTCKISPGEPKAKVTWFKGDKELKDDKRITMTYNVKDGTASLEIKPSEPADSNGYRIVAKNKMGEVHSDATLTVHGKYGNSTSR